MGLASLQPEQGYWRVPGAAVNPVRRRQRQLHEPEQPVSRHGAAAMNFLGAIGRLGMSLAYIYCFGTLLCKTSTAVKNAADFFNQARSASNAVTIGLVGWTHYSDLRYQFHLEPGCQVGGDQNDGPWLKSGPGRM